MLSQQQGLHKFGFWNILTRKMSEFQDTWGFIPCFSQTESGFHVVLYLLIDTQYFSCWAKCGNVLFIWHCGNAFNWMEKNILIKWNSCLVAMHTHPNNLPLEPVHGLLLQLLDTEPYSRAGICFPWPCWDTKTNFPIQPQPQTPTSGQ